MTPIPNNLPAPADMTLEELLREMARVLHNAGGDERGAGYSAKLADAAMKWADDLPGWKPIETAPRDGNAFIAYEKSQMGDFGYVQSMRDFSGRLVTTADHGDWMGPTHWYDFGGGAALPPAPEGGE